ncbi:phosphatase PAP2 family protein [Catellatospora sp. KI3]|uniref:phosphatase PAP2 family protein n=1 Tax=Catellatospora sp. KI3 TaxID=3041620 RepID=UPI0024827F11|nr:phosphatase PAP2 family protein [Catellatospora sp. KI3]MDI1463494.1 phosphatase PAP2 family protein [Catellatospora sp. KI3]
MRTSLPVAVRPRTVAATHRRTVRPLDIVFFGYLAAAGTTVALCHQRVPHWWAYLAAYAATAVAAAALIAAHVRRPRSRPLTALRLTYPVIAAPVCYTMVGGTALAVHGRFLDDEMNRAEVGLFGGHPALWLGAAASRPLTELVYACYMSYYLYIVVPPLLLLARRRHADLERLVTTVGLAAYLCYLGFLAVPVRGPAYSLADQLEPATLPGYVLAPAQQHLMALADPVGTCFPSAHVAVAWAVSFTAARIWGRRVLYPLLPLTIGLTVATVYTRYHYVADVLAGLLVALAAYALVAYVWRRRGPGPDVYGPSRADGS